MSKTVDQVKRAGSKDKANDLAIALAVLLHKDRVLGGGPGGCQSGQREKSRESFPIYENYTANKIAQFSL